MTGASKAKVKTGSASTTNTKKISDFLAKQTKTNVNSPATTNGSADNDNGSEIPENPFNESNDYSNNSTMDIDLSVERTNKRLKRIRRNSLPLFDPTDDKDDFLEEEDLMLTPPPPSAKYKTGISLSSLPSVSATKSDSTAGDGSSDSSGVGGAGSNSNTKNLLVYEDDDDDLDLILNSSYDFLMADKKSKAGNNDASDGSEKAQNSKRVSTATTRLSRKTSSELFDSIMSSAGANRAANKYSFSLESLLRDKEQREKQLEETKLLEEMITAENADENSTTRESAATKYLAKLLGETEHSQNLASKSTLKKKRKTFSEDDISEDKEESDQDEIPNDDENSDEYDVDEEEILYSEGEEERLDAEAKMQSDKSTRNANKRIKNMVMESLKTVTIDKVVLFDEDKVFAHRQDFSFLFLPARGDSMGQIIFDALNGGIFLFVLLDEKLLCLTHTHTKDEKSCETFLGSETLIRAIEDANWYFPDELALWLFQTACHSKSEFKATTAAKSLNKYFEYFSNRQGTWVITDAMFHAILEAYGVDYGLLMKAEDCGEKSVGAFLKSVSRVKAMEGMPFRCVKFPAFNFALCVELYTSCLVNRSNHYPPQALENGFLLLTKLSMDQKLATITGDLLAKSVSKLGRKLSDDNDNTHTSEPNKQRCDSTSSTSSAVASVAYITNSLYLFVGPDPKWQHVLICRPYSALLGSLAAPSAAGCPTQRGMGFIARIRKQLACMCVIGGGVDGGYRKNGADYALSSSTLTSNVMLMQRTFEAVNNVVAQYTVESSKTDYARLSLRVQVLAAAIGGIGGVRENKHEAKRLCGILARMHGNISDMNSLSLDRTEAKEQIHDLKTWIDLSLPPESAQASITAYYN
ncbi:hypothetical protein HK100_008427 [Physocladia obscura]|uniref:Uncharacterized protein n=1 Tax=Physocladia obscura TaxID=109957 RepID=A0AAD5TA13_9FUNG|nr:hypothetical protein HK100_008427 [Physocladia obscura]